MDGSARESMTEQERDEWVRFRAWQRHRHSDRHAVAAAQAPPEVPGASNVRRVLFVAGIAVVAVVGALALSAVEDTGVVGDTAGLPASAGFVGAPSGTDGAGRDGEVRGGEVRGGDGRDDEVRLSPG